jgi:hypothetical protein
MILLTINEVMDRLKCSKRHVYRPLGKEPDYIAKRPFRVLQASLDAYIARNTVCTLRGVSRAVKRPYNARKKVHDIPRYIDLSKGK